MEPVREAEEISNIAFGYIASKALFAALHINVFTLLAKGPLTAADIAAKTSVPENRVTTLVTVLLSLGLLTKVSEGFENSPGAASFLSRGAKYDFSDYLRYQVDRQMFPFMADLEAVAASDDADVPALQGWRREVFGDDALRLKHGEIALGAGHGKVRMVEIGDPA